MYYTVEQMATRDAHCTVLHSFFCPHLRSHVFVFVRTRFPMSDFALGWQAKPRICYYYYLLQLGCTLWQ
jgi:hypothetical protein